MDLQQPEDQDLPQERSLQTERRLRKLMGVRDDHLIDTGRKASHQFSVRGRYSGFPGIPLGGGCQGGVATPAGQGEKHPRSCIPGTTTLIL